MDDLEKTLGVLGRAGLYPAEDAVSLDGFSDAVIGVDMDGRIVYSYDLVLGKMIGEGYEYDEAVAWIDFNVTGFHAGEMSPVIVNDRVGRMADERKES